MSKKIITMSVYNRPDYTRQVMEALTKCEGIGEYQIIIHADGYNEEVRDVVMSFEKLKWSYFENGQRLGCSENIMNAVRHGFELSDYVIHVEDDIVLAPSALRWFEWAGEKFKDNKDIFDISSFRKEQTKEEDFYSYAIWRWFTPWGWATWKDRFEVMDRIYKAPNSGKCWDEVCNFEASLDKFEVIPRLARSRNIGERNGTHHTPQGWHEVADNPFGAWLPDLNIDPNVKDYKETTIIY